ncbi:MAG: 3'-5' exonuclease [Opitutaceae bacterium]
MRASGVPWTDQAIHFVDFEGSRASGILEFGIATVRSGSIEAARTRLCAPAGPIAAADAAVHGLAASRLRGHAPFSADWGLFAALRESGPFAAHYAGTENGLIKAVWPFARPSPDFVRVGERTVEWGPWIDTARLYARFYPALDSGRLESIVAATGLQGELDRLAAAHCPPDRRRYHAALYDALAGALLLIAVAREPGCAASLSIGHLLVLSTLDPARRTALTQPELFS